MALPQHNLRLLLVEVKQEKPSAINQLGYLYFNGKENLPKNDAKALHYFLQAAKLGFAGAQYNCGLMYAQGTGTHQDHQKAASWYHQAALQSHSLALYNLSLMYRDGLGVGKNEDKSFQLFQIAAKAGLLVAERQLAQYF